MSDQSPDLCLDLVVGGTIPTITSNFTELKAAITARLESYKIQVTEENLAQAKKDATELGKAATQLNKLKTEKAKEFSAPVDAFKAQVMELGQIIQDGQEFIKKQVKTFEDKTRATCLEKMTAALKGAYLTLSVHAEYQTGAAKLPELVGISKVTAKGELTKAAKDQVMALATADRGVQDRTTGRLATLTADCLTAGLKAPLSRVHVEGILHADDEQYRAGLARLIATEVQRQEATLKAEQERMQREATEKAEREAVAKRKAEKEQEEADRKAMQARMAEEQAKEQAKQKAEEKESPMPLYQPPPPAPAFVFPVSKPPAVPLKRQLSVVVTFQIETAKTAPEELAITAEWFKTQIKTLPLMPPFQIEIKGA